MNLSELSTLGEVIGRQAEDPEFREEWDRSAFARKAAIRVARYRVERGLTQAQLVSTAGRAAAVGDSPPGARRAAAFPGPDHGGHGDRAAS